MPHQRFRLFSGLILLPAILSMSIGLVYAQESCTSLALYTKALEKLVTEQVAVQEKIAPLLERKDTSTTDLIEQGYAYLRAFNKNMKNICEDMLTTPEKVPCATLPGEMLVTNAYDSCHLKAQYYFQVERQKFDQYMIYDAGQKKYQFIVNKLLDINKKFRDLVALFGMLKGQLSALNDNMGKVTTKVHSGGGS